MDNLGPFDMNGSAFLALYAGLMAVTVVAGVIVPVWQRPEGRRQAVTAADQLAWLAGGATRLAETVVTRLLTAGVLALAGKQFVVAGRAGGLDGAEARIGGLRQPMRWTAIAAVVKPEAAAVERRLVAAGLVMDAEATRAARWRQTMPLLLLWGFGMVKWVVGDLRERPVGILTGLLVVTAVLALLRWMRVDRRTEAGHAALAAARRQSERLKRAPMAAETGMAVALFGTVVLAGSGWAGFHALRSDRSGDGGDGGSGDGGCGGGGCGGCGS